jgi:arsenical pump membrane protein
MPYLTAYSILAVTVGISLSRPRIGTFQIHHSHAAVLGAMLCLVSGIVPPALAVHALQVLLRPLVTIVSLMVMTLIAERLGLFNLLGDFIARISNRDGRRLFRCLFFCGTMTGVFFSNDAAVLIFTPLAFDLVERLSTADWKASNKLPFYFAVLFVANLVGGLVISNPINVIVATLFDISFLEYAAWMLLPTAASIFVSYYGLLWFFRRDIPAVCGSGIVTRVRLRPNGTTLLIGSGLLLATLVGFFSESLTGIPTWAVAVGGAIGLAVLYRSHPVARRTPVLSGVAWDIVVFVIGMFIVANGLRNVGVTHQIGSLLRTLAGEGFSLLSGITALVSAVCSSLINNHPTANIMAMVIDDFKKPVGQEKMLAFSALIGGDLGPKMLPIGSLAALLWFRMLRDRGVDVPYGLYIKVGIPVTLCAVILSVIVLNLEYALFSP